MFIKYFLSEVLATVLGVMIIVLLLAFYSADPDTRVHCDAVTDNPFSQTNCIIRDTLR